MFLGPLVLIAVIALVVYAVMRARPPAGAVPPRLPIDALLARWRAAGLLTADQADVISRYEAGTTPGAPVAPSFEAPVAPPDGDESRADRRVPVVAEAVGYLGGILALTGLVLVVARSWPDMATAARLALSGAGVVAFFVAGQLVNPDRDPALQRLRGFAWVASSACAALFAGVVAADGFGAEAAETITAAASAGVVAESGLLWLWRQRSLPFQQLTLFAGVAVLVGSVVALATDTGPVGIAVWVTGAVLAVIGLRRLAPMPLIGDVVGGISMSVGAMLTVAAWNETALPFVVATSAALLAVALVPGPAPETGDQLAFGIIGVVTGLQVAPAAIGYFAQDAGVVTGLIVWLAGLGSLYLGIRAVVRLPVVVEALGAIAMLVGAAVTGVQVEGFAPLFGIVTAIGLVAVGALPGRAHLSLVGSGGLLINVLWAIGHFFPGEGRAPLMVMVAGALILAIAVWLTRSGRHPRRGRGVSPHTSAPGTV